MASPPTVQPDHLHIMQQLESLMELTDDGDEFWRARAIHRLLGYPVWQAFVPSIRRAYQSLVAGGDDPSHHIAQTNHMMGVGNDARRVGVDYFLNRAACYLIAMNGDSSKAEIAAAQRYFAVQTRRTEIADQSVADRQRVDGRDRVSAAFKRVSDAAKHVGVRNFGRFHDARWRGLYGMSMSDVTRLKSVPEGDHLFDHANSLELSAHAFQMEIASKRLAGDFKSGEDNAVSTNESVAIAVRKTLEEQTGQGLAQIGLSGEPIKAVKARLLGKSPTKQLPKS